MHVLIINFNLRNLNHEDFVNSTMEVAEYFAAIPKLISKKFIANEETNTYGGVYLFESKQAMIDYKESELFAQLGSNPAFVNFVITDFELLEEPSRVTHAV